MSITIELSGSVAERLLSIASAYCISNGKHLNIIWYIDQKNDVDSYFTDIFQIPSKISVISSKEEAENLKKNASIVIKTVKDQPVSINTTDQNVYLISNSELIHENITFDKMSAFLSSLKFTFFMDNLIESAYMKVFKPKNEKFDLTGVVLPDIRLEEGEIQNLGNIEKYIAEMRILLIEKPKTIFLVHSTTPNSYFSILNGIFHQLVIFLPKYFCTKSQQLIINKMTGAVRSHRYHTPLKQ